ncbi:MAG TPA: YggS family pyridoxal phosphate-dependent enzyme [Ferruginibacter sp.]|nr:YggS family pyridoxal phosphate-dependent enzyme [Ferruginibacter sp.]
MGINKQQYQKIISELDGKATLVAVSKTKPLEDIKELYDLGQRDFGENYVQELVDKYEQLPKDIKWHFIGHLQSNKVKYIAPFVHLIHAVDSEKLFKEINKQAAKYNQVINCLLQVHISAEVTKYGFDEVELTSFLNSDLTQYKNANICGLMGMASFTEDNNLIKKEFTHLKMLFDQFVQISSLKHQLSILSMGMSADYAFAINAGSNMVRIGSLLFGSRIYNK